MNNSLIRAKNQIIYIKKRRIKAHFYAILIFNNGGFCMHLLKILLDPAVLIVIIAFFGITFYYIKKVRLINRELLDLITFLKKFKKSDLSFRFKELDNGMSAIPCAANLWAEFKNTLMFSESVSLKNENNDMIFQNISQSMTSIQTTVEPICFFNEETLVTSKLNYKFIQTAPTILTGLGPLFTFMNIGIAFSAVDFSTQETTLHSVSALMASMQIAATVSVLAVSSSLLFLLIERVLFNNMCKIPLNTIQEILSKLFDNISSEKFLIELLKETKIQNNTTKNLLAVMPNQFKDALDKSLSSILVPYLENLIFGVNKIQEKFQDPKKSSDIVDDLF